LEPVLAPPKPCRAAEHRQIHQLDQGPFLDHRRRSTPDTHRPRPAGFDIHPDRFIRCGVDAEHGDVGQTNEQLTDTDRVCFHRGSPI
jgi:hypothetical protein